MSDECYYSQREELMREWRRREDNLIDCRCEAEVRTDEVIRCDGCGALGCAACMTQDATGHHLCRDDDDCRERVTGEDQ